MFVPYIRPRPETGLTGAVLEGMFVQSEEEVHERYGFDGEAEERCSQSGRGLEVSVVDSADEGGLGTGVWCLVYASDSNRVRSELAVLGFRRRASRDETVQMCSDDVAIQEWAVAGEIYLSSQG